MDDVKAKIVKLLAMANDGRGNEFEAEAALRHAETLMRKHGIDAAMLQDRTGERPVYHWQTVLVPAGAPQPVKSSPLWFGFLISAIGKFTDCKVSYTRAVQYGMCAEFSGDVTDVQYAVWLCKHLRDDCRRQSDLNAHLWVSVGDQSFHSDIELQYRDAYIRDFAGIGRMYKTTQRISKGLERLYKRYGQCPGNADARTIGMWLRYSDVIGMDQCVIYDDDSGRGWSYDDASFRFLSLADGKAELARRIDNVRAFLTSRLPASEANEAALRG